MSLPTRQVDGMKLTTTMVVLTQQPLVLGISPDTLEIKVFPTEILHSGLPIRCQGLIDAHGGNPIK